MLPGSWHLPVRLGDVPGGRALPVSAVLALLPIGRSLESGSAQDFCQSLEEAGPEIRACVDACNYIANATREQNDFSSVSWGQGGAGPAWGAVGAALTPPPHATGRRAKSGSW